MEIVKSNQLIKCDVKPVFEHINTACDQLKCSKIVAKVFAYIGYSFSIILPLTDLCILLGNMCSLKSTSSLPQVDGPQVDVPQVDVPQGADEQEVDEQEVDEQVAGPQSTGARLYPPTQTGDQAALTRVLGQWATPYASGISAMMAQMLGIDTNPARPLPTTFSLNLEYARSGVVIDGLDVPLKTEFSRYDFIVRALLGRPDFDLCSGFLFYSPNRKEMTEEEINTMEVSPGRHMPLAFIPVEDQELIQALAAIKANYSLENFCLRTPKLQDNRRVVLAAVAKNGREFAWVSKRLQADFDVALAAVNRYGWALEHASKELQDNGNLVLAAITQNGRALEHASARHKKDRDIVLAAITQHGDALKYANKEFQDDYGLVFAAIDNKGSAFKYASKRLKGNRDLALAAVTKDWRMFYFASYKTDPELILAVINSKNTTAFHLAMEYTGKCYIEGRGYIKLREDYQFMFKAVTKNGCALEYASKELQNNLTLVLAAVTENGFAIRYASAELQADAQVIEAARRQ